MQIVLKILSHTVNIIWTERTKERLAYVSTSNTLAFSTHRPSSHEVGLLDKTAVLVCYGSWLSTSSYLLF